MSSASALIGRINEFIIIPLLGFILALALLYFVWGLAQFILNADSEEGRSTGRSHMIWGIVGLFVMISVLGILQILAGTFDFSLPK